MPQNAGRAQLGSLADQGTHLRLESFSILIIQSRALDGSVPYPRGGLISQMFFCSYLFFLVLNLKSSWWMKPMKPILQKGPEPNPIAIILSTTNELLWFAPAKE